MAKISIYISKNQEEIDLWRKWINTRWMDYEWQFDRNLELIEYRLPGGDGGRVRVGADDITETLTDVLILGHGGMDGERFLYEFNGQLGLVADTIRLALHGKCSARCKFRVQICSAGGRPDFINRLVPYGVTATAPRYWSYLSSLHGSRRAIDLRRDYPLLTIGELRMLTVKKNPNFYFVTNFNDVFFPEDDTRNWRASVAGFTTPDARTRTFLSAIAEYDPDAEETDAAEENCRTLFSSVIKQQREDLFDHMFGKNTASVTGVIPLAPPPPDF